MKVLIALAVVVGLTQPVAKSTPMDWELSHEVWNYCGSMQVQNEQDECFAKNGGHEPY